jgi:predicted RNA-binding protein with PIN domain
MAGFSGEESCGTGSYRIQFSAGFPRNCYHVFMSHRLIIDGYNLMHAVGLVRGKLVGKQLEGARARLLRRLAYQLTKDERASTIVVFDAKTILPVSSREELIEGFRVLYPEPGHEADELIEQLIAQETHPRKLRIVSSDRRLHRAARERMAAAINSDKFLDELDERKPAPVDPPPVAAPRPAVEIPSLTPKSGTPQKPAPVDVNYWLKEFGDIEIPDNIEIPEGLVSPSIAPEDDPEGQSQKSGGTRKTGSPASGATGSSQNLRIPLPPQPGGFAAPLPQKPARHRPEPTLTDTSAPAEEKRDPELEFWERELKQVLDEERRKST